MQLREALTSAVSRLSVERVPSPRMNAELLLMFVLSCDRAYLYAHPERDLTGDEQSRYEHVLAERSRGIPAQYITGHQEFWGMDLIVSPAVLIPRPETEHVVETVLELLTSEVGPQPTALGPRTSASKGGMPNAGSQMPRSEVRGLTSEVRSSRSEVRGLRSEVRGLKSDVRIADVGTGSGCIALALAKELPKAEIHAIDISPAGLDIARANAARHQLESRIQFHEIDLLAGFGDNFFDFVVSNPPYVGEAEADQVQLEVRKFEPRNAVFAGPTGLEVIRRLIPQAHAALKPEAWLVLETSGTIADQVKEILRDWDEVQIMPDLQSIPRVARARKARA